ncbi:pitrilysin family protein [Telluribacter sp. SYSU D00476]|uniref:M16 family metallopeptidase n=1 Tax=Telluribacter sp. SYSU D00476 TaxID=2811430 RepID=UPI001FF526EF|nr:pitrilysin family protein [Telluribacter sp. SYSU D00476]
MQLDRTIAPSYRIIRSIHLPDAETVTLDNGIVLHVINIGDQPVVRLECIFDAGTWYESQPGASYFAIKMLPEGTLTRSSAGISEAFDYVGAFTEMTHSADRAGIMVYCLTRFLPEVLPLVQELIAAATFPEKEWEDLQNITLQNLRVNQEKNAFLATRQLRASLYGTEHPYGRSQSEEQINQVSREAAQAHYEQHIRNSSYRIILSGQVGQQEIQLVNQYLGQVQGLTTPSEAALDSSVLPAGGGASLTEKAESLQSSIRLGKRLLTRKHPDYFKMLVTNEILGGYFGSRLMKNIREEKGLTYGISSSVITLRHDGYFTIGTDVKKEFTQQTLDEIRKEIHLLQTQPVPDDELQNVKNFMAGEFAGSLNTAFEVADRQKILLLDELPADFFDRYIDQIHATTAEDIQRIANQYLQLDDLTEVVVGGK